MTSTPDRVVIVGASAAGVATADALRTEGYRGTIAIVGDEHAPPYDRPPLSKQLLDGTWDATRLALRDPAHYQSQGFELHLGARAVGVDTGGREVELNDGRRLAYDALVIATGVGARPLPLAVRPDRLHYLRTLEDSLRLRQALIPGARLVIVGAGFIGLETAATAVGLGCAVSVIDPIALPLSEKVGRDVGVRVRDLHLEHGVRLYLGATVERVAEDEAGHANVVLDDGTSVPADCILIGVGTVAHIGWLAGSGLETPSEVGGLPCDEYGRVDDHVLGVGDVAAVVDVRTGRRVRREHRQNANDHGRLVAGTIMGRREAFAATPYFWSDQFGVRIQMYGDASPEADVEVVELPDPATTRLVVTYRVRGELEGVLGWNAAKHLLPYRRELLERLTTAGI